MIPNYTATVILLAGGIGQRMGASMPKQYLTLGGKPIARYALDCFSLLPEVVEIIVVCEEKYCDIFENAMPDIDLHFAAPGVRRQDSLINGYRAAKAKSDLICVHDAARPFVSASIAKRVMDAAMAEGAAAAALPLKFTVKETDSNGYVVNTPDRSKIWEIQTPQAIMPELLSEGIALSEEMGATVTDDVSFVELIRRPVRLVHGDETNIKVTTPHDLRHAEAIMASQGPLLSSLQARH